MNNDEITHIMRHLLANSRTRFLGVLHQINCLQGTQFKLLFNVPMSQTLMQLGKAGLTV